MTMAKTKTEQLREEMRQPCIYFAKEYGEIWPSYGSYSQHLERLKDCEDRLITQILQILKEAGFKMWKEIET